MIKSISFTLLGLLFLLQSASAVTIEAGKYNRPHKILSILSDRATNLKNPNCIRKWINSHYHKTYMALGCRIDSVSIFRDELENGGEIINFSPNYRCEAKNYALSTGIACRLKSQ